MVIVRYCLLINRSISWSR